MKIFGNATFEIAESDRILRAARELRREASSFPLREHATGTALERTTLALEK